MLKTKILLITLATLVQSNIFSSVYVSKNEKIKIEFQKHKENKAFVLIKGLSSSNEKVFVLTKEKQSDYYEPSLLKNFKIKLDENHKLYFILNKKTMPLDKSKKKGKDLKSLFEKQINKLKKRNYAHYRVEIEKKCAPSISTNDGPIPWVQNSFKQALIDFCAEDPLQKDFVQDNLKSINFWEVRGDKMNMPEFVYFKQYKSIRVKFDQSYNNMYEMMYFYLKKLKGNNG
jgi:hypothetical protein